MGPSAFAQVLLDTEVKSLQGRTFTYKIPDEMRDELRVGQPVTVPFGRQPAVTGFVTALSETASGDYKIREITDVLDETPLFDADYLTFLQWVSHYYGCSLYQVIHCAMPSHVISKIRKEISVTEAVPDAFTLGEMDRSEQQLIAYLKRYNRGFTPKYIAGQIKVPLKQLNRSVARLKKLGFVRVHTSVSKAGAPKTVKRVKLLNEDGAKTTKQREVIQWLKEQSGEALQKAVPASAAVLKKLVEQQAVEIEDAPVVRDPLAYLASVGRTRDFELSANQQQVVDAVMAQSVSDSVSDPLLLFGITGSGKTEVYMTLTEKTLAEGKSVLIMVPEIALTSQIARRFIERFGQENIALWHSNLSEGERVDTWRRMARGELKIVIGARSAVFAPLQELGLIVMDEQHDGSFKQESPAPRYHAKTLAEERARRSKARLVMGSATPDIADYYLARKSGHLLRLTERFGGRSLADVHIVDMRDEKRRGHGGVISQRLMDELSSNLTRQEQSLVLINRRGFHTLIQCQHCNFVFRCPSCDVSLTYHRQANAVRCHHCGHSAAKPEFCTQCASSHITTTGTGTQRVEEQLAKALPEARILRLDSDVLSRRDAFREILDTFSAGEADILVGTQMVAKGLDISNVTLVGVVNADSSFYLPDYRSAERGFQLLTQVAGRAGRGEKSGRVVFQTMEPHHPVLQFAREQDYESFFEHEMQVRQNMLFPPFSQLFRLIIVGENEMSVRQYAQALAENLRHQISQTQDPPLDQAMLVLGPAPCVISKIQGQYRVHCLVKNNGGEPGHSLMTGFHDRLNIPEGLRVILDVDSQSLL